jgi:putative addiction module killer protein
LPIRAIYGTIKGVHVLGLLVFRTKEFEEWLSERSFRELSSIYTRLGNIEQHSHLGDFKYLGEGLYELRWRNGTRIYFTKYNDQIILLLGGHKNAQKKDIKNAKNILQRLT